MESVKNKVEEIYEFLLQDSTDNSHDYFLQNIPPASAKSYLRGQLTKKEKIKAEIYIAIDEDHRAVSLPECPFGGFWTSDDLSSEAISYFINALKHALADREVKTFIVIQAPSIYCHQTELISYLLYTAGFNLLNVVSHQVYLGKKKVKKLSQFYSTKNQKKIKDYGFQITIGKVQNFGFLSDITFWNQSRGYLSTISQEKLVSQVSLFPDRYHVISIMQSGKPVGHALGVKLTSESLYYFLSGINPKNQHSLTGELIIASLIKLAADLKVRVLDFGTSNLGNEPNHKLIFFKSKFANEYCNKSTWQIELK